MHNRNTCNCPSFGCLRTIRANIGDKKSVRVRLARAIFHVERCDVNHPARTVAPNEHGPRALGKAPLHRCCFLCAAPSQTFFVGTHLLNNLVWHASVRYVLALTCTRRRCVRDERFWIAVGRHVTRVIKALRGWVATEVPVRVELRQVNTRIGRDGHCRAVVCARQRCVALVGTHLNSDGWRRRRQESAGS